MKTPLSLLFMLVLSQKVLAAKLDLATHDSLIQKLESAVDTESSDAMLLQHNMTYRLADLYAERARLLSMDEQGKGDKIHAVQIRADRKKSISILNKVLTALPKSDQGPALMQMAHLHILMNNSDAALKIFRQIEKSSSNYDNRTIALVYIQLGDYSFVNGNFSDAETYFMKASRIKENPRPGYTQFRAAWVNYNQGETLLAEKQLTQLLRRPELLTAKDGTPDTSFQEEATHDLALFMAKNDITQTSIQTLSDVSPESTRKKNLIFLASELDRTAKKVSALKVWKIVGTYEITMEDKLDRQIQITRIEYDLGHRSALVIEVDRSIALVQQCGDKPECTVARQNLRRVITDWAKAEERIPTPELIVVFQKFTTAFSDYEMSYWAAQAAFKRKQYKEAYQFHIQTTSFLKSVREKNAVQLKMFEGSLLGAIEVAELANDLDLRFFAYNQYLDLNPKGQKNHEVKYQLAHLQYEKNDYVKASIQFRILALDKDMPQSLREKSADLCLDSDVLVKNEAIIESHSLELSKLFSTKKSEYLAIYRKSILNQSARILNELVAAGYEQELDKLNGLKLNQFPPNEAKVVIKNKMELAYRLRNIDALAKHANELLSLKKLPEFERQMALHHLVWIAELKMNFKLAIKMLAQIQPTAAQQADYHLKMATLKELAQENPTKAYENFLATSRNDAKNAFAAHQIVLFAKKPLKVFKNFESTLSRSPDLYASAGVFVFENTKDEGFAKQILKSRAIRNSLNGQLLAHIFAFKSLAEFNKEIKKNKLVAKPDSVLKRRLLQREQMLKQLDKLANKAIAQKDTSLQLVYLSQVAEENTQLASEITALPVPSNLKPAEVVKYRKQISEMVLPYLTKSQAVMMKTQEIWKQAVAQDTFLELSECSVQKARPGCQLAATEMTYLKASARTAGLATDPFEKLSEQQQKTLSEAESLRQKIQANPFNISDLAQLKILQSSLGRGPMVAYLDSRLTEMQKRGKSGN